MKEMTDSVAEAFIINALKEAKRPLLTREIEERTRAAEEQCPDSAVRFLNKLRLKGAIKGELSIEKRGWVWWVE
ncbi:MAG: hypothetical protein KAT70_02395 [Thermoplasmata archaeon]|nr:hypothetical protein [Thermoplasmata archaeon]